MQKQSLMEPKTAPERGALWDHYQEVRGDSERLCAPLQTEDYCIQTMPDVSPAKWHLAHVSWFFENFLLRPLLPGYRPFHPQFGYLFNSYYETVGSFWPRPQRGLLSRPTVAEVYRYRAHVDGHMAALIDGARPGDREICRQRTTLGLHHEQQHQELLLTDLKSVFALNPLRPAYHEGVTRPPCAATQAGWWDYAGSGVT